MLLSGVAASALVRTPRASASKKATAFALIGDRYHNSDYIRTALRKTLVKDLGITIDFRDEVELLNAEELKGYETAKGTVRFPLDKKLPVTLIRKLLKAGMARNAAKAKVRATKKKK